MKHAQISDGGLLRDGRRESELAVHDRQFPDHEGPRFAVVLCVVCHFFVGVFHVRLSPVAVGDWKTKTHRRLTAVGWKFVFLFAIRRIAHR